MYVCKYVGENRGSRHSKQIADKKNTVEICERIRLSISAIGCSIKAIKHITAFRAREKNKIWDFEVGNFTNGYSIWTRGVW